MTISFADAAPTLHDNGLIPIPVAQGTKRPVIPNWPNVNYDLSPDLLDQLCANHPNASTGIVLGDVCVIDIDVLDADTAIGVPTGNVSGIVVLDIDVHKGKDGREYLSALSIPIPATSIASTPSGGLHYYFANPEVRMRTTAGVLGPWTPAPVHRYMVHVL